MQQDNNILEEGLRSRDLVDLVYPSFDVDTFKSKMGEDQDVCVISFRVKDRSPARDLMEFVEKGYGFVLDADVSSGENNQGEYLVFVEIPRTPKLAENINEILYGVKKLTGIDNWHFRYHKQKENYESTIENIKNVVPQTPGLYENRVKENKIKEFKDFFSKTLMDDLTYENGMITIHKPYDQKISFQLIREDSKAKILETISEPLSLDPTAISEIFWLTKVVGDYEIDKIGDSFVFNHGDRSMILRRMTV